MHLPKLSPVQERKEINDVSRYPHIALACDWGKNTHTHTHTHTQRKHLL